MSPDRVRDHENPSGQGPPQPKAAALGAGMPYVITIESIRVTERGSRLFERNSMLREVRGSLPWIPLEHAFCIYGILAGRASGVGAVRYARDGEKHTTLMATVARRGSRLR